MTPDACNATQPYRVRAGGVWYWVDPTVPRSVIEPGDTVIVYSVHGDAHVLAFRGGGRDDAGAQTAVLFAAPDGAAFEMAPAEVAAVHLAALDEDQSARANPKTG
jgi:hypothetical protein